MIQIGIFPKKMSMKYGELLKYSNTNVLRIKFPIYVKSYLTRLIFFRNTKCAIKLPNYTKVWSLRFHLIDDFILYIYIIKNFKYPLFTFLNQIIKKRF